MTQKNKSIRILLMFLVLSFPLLLTAQVQEITGKVTGEEDGTPLPGVTVLSKGTTIGTVTDFDGNYRLSVQPGNTLVFSYIGYSNKEVVVTDQTTIDVTLSEETQELDEVVVIGYGVQKKSDRTGAVYNVTSEDIQTVAVQDPIEGIQGKVPGVTIRKSGSDPNAGFDVKIRGASGLTSSTDPLYVVDGIVGVDPTTIAPEDIESFNVLKDASSAAIYGSRGANGVIIITTKKGTANATLVEVSSYATMEQVSKRSRLDLMSAEDYLAFGDELGFDMTTYNKGFSTDWQDEIYRTGLSHNESVAISGGNEKSTYRASVSNNQIAGVIKNSSKNRTIMRLNSQTKAFDDKLMVSMNLANTIEENSYINYGSPGADGTLFQAFQRNPTLPVYDSIGNYYQDPTPPVNNYSNPVAIINDIQNERSAKRLLAGVRADYELFENFKLTLNSAYTRDDDESFYFEPASNGPLPGEGRASRKYSNNDSRLIEAFANYDRSLNNNNLNMVAGYSYQVFKWDGFSAQGKNPSSDLTQSNDLRTIALVVPGDIDSWKGESRLISSFARVAYNYDQKYFVTATIRRDGSSKFGANHQWGIFPSGSVKWNLKRESFMENISALSMADIRVGYGQTGNQEIPSYANMVLFGITGYTLDPITNQYTVNYGPIQNGNPDLKWEVNSEINIGLDFGFLNNRITASVDAYQKNTFDLLYVYNVQVPPNLVPTTLANGGKIDIKGIEAVITGHILSNDAVSWKSTFVATHSKAIVTKLSNENFLPISKVDEGGLQEPLGYGTNTQIMREGEERGTWYGPKFVGIDSRTSKFLYETATEGIYKTLDRLVPADYKKLGTAQPAMEIGWSNSINLLKSIDIDFTFRGMFGHDVLNATNMVFDNPSYFPTRNILRSAPDRTELIEASAFSDYFLEKGNFIRLENITVGYTIPISNAEFIKSARVFVAGNNLLTLSKYTGIDPSTIGIDIFNIYPKSTSLTAGFNMRF
jgi:TonB-dependent starch-binding outer membrane protein SusC